MNTTNRAELAFSRLDSNSDGSISLAELTAAFAWETELSDETLLSMFDALDADQDDALSLDELKAEEERQKAEFKNGSRGKKMGGREKGGKEMRRKPGHGGPHGFEGSRDLMDPDAEVAEAGEI
ncbi:EF hand [compost metagenome]